MHLIFRKNIYGTVLVFLLPFFYSCKKEDPGKTNSFTWVHNGISHTTTVDTAHLSAIGRIPFTIVAGEKKPGYHIYERVEFNLTSFNEGVYGVNTGSGQHNRVTYTNDAGNTQIGAGGTINITKNSNNYLSGYFSTTIITGAGVSSMLTGDFTNMPVK